MRKANHKHREASLSQEYTRGAETEQLKINKQKKIYISVSRYIIIKISLNKYTINNIVI